MNQERVIINAVQPQIDCGRYPVKRILGEKVDVKAHVLVDGHDLIQASVLFKAGKSRKWQESQMQENSNDEWSGEFGIDKQVDYTYKIQAWVDYSLNWQHGISRKLQDDQHVHSELLDGVAHLENAFAKANKSEKPHLKNAIEAFQDKDRYEEAVKFATSNKLQELFEKYPEKRFAAESDELQVTVDRKKARFSTWYEFFPRSAGKGYEHGTFKDCKPIALCRGNGI